MVEKLLSQKNEKEKLAFVGDGINDAPVLSRADIGIAMGAMGSDAAIEAADIVLMDDDPLKIAKAIRIARKCMRIVYENIYFAIGDQGNLSASWCSGYCQYVGCDFCGCRCDGYCRAECDSYIVCEEFVSNLSCSGTCGCQRAGCQQSPSCSRTEQTGDS